MREIMEYTLTFESMTALNSKSDQFKEQVILFAEENSGIGVTFDDFEKWLNQKGFRLVATDKKWKAVLSSIIKRRFYYEVSYKYDCDRNLITVFTLKCIS